MRVRLPPPLPKNRNNMRTDSDKKSEYVSKILSYLGEGYPSPIGTKIRDIVEHEVEHRLKMGSVDVVRDSINALSGDWSRVMSDLSKAMAKEPSGTSYVAGRIDDSTEDERLVASMHSFSKPKEQRLAEFEAYLAEADEDEATRAFWAGVDKAAKEVRGWPAWKRGEWCEYPATVSASEATPQADDMKKSGG